MKITVLKKSHQDLITKILSDVNFFNTDIYSNSYQKFLGYWLNNELVGIVGIELINNNSIIRSLVIKKIIEAMELQLHYLPMPKNTH